MERGVFVKARKTGTEREKEGLARKRGSEREK